MTLKQLVRMCERPEVTSIALRADTFNKLIEEIGSPVTHPEYSEKGIEHFYCKLKPVFKTHHTLIFTMEARK